jgi:hypothetical protein
MSVLTPPEFFLDPADMEDFEIGAWLMAILAFPGAGEHDLRQAAAEALCAGCVRVTVAADPQTAEHCRGNYPLYSSIDQREEKRRLRTLENRLRRRMVAAKMSLAFIEEGITGEPAKLPEGMTGLNIDALSRLVQPETKESDPQNLENRVWRESLPVIHLAAAMQWLLRYLEGEGGNIDTGYRMDNGPMHSVVIAIAERYEPLVLADRRFGAIAEKMIRVRQPTTKSSES